MDSNQVEGDSVERSGQRPEAADRFSLSVTSEVTCERALKAADELEQAIGEIANGLRKPSHIPGEAIAVLVTFARQVVLEAA